MFRIWIITVSTAVLSGCSRTPQPLHELSAASSQSVTDYGKDFTPERCGDLNGRIVWNGPKPQSEPFNILRTLPVNEPNGPNKLLPQISPDGGVGGALIALRGIDLRRARPFDLPKPLVIIKNREIEIAQGGRSDQRIGIIRRGETLTMSTHSDGATGIRATGAAFFTMMFDRNGTVRERIVKETGWLELSEATGAYWVRAWLYATDHPYVTTTDDRGEFSLSQVPDGNYELTITLPSWRWRDYDRDPEMMHIKRLNYHQPLLRTSTIRIVAGKMSRIELTIGE